MHDEGEAKERRSTGPNGIAKQEVDSQAEKGDCGSGGIDAMEGSREGFGYFLRTDNGKYMKIGVKLNLGCSGPRETWPTGG